MKFNAKATLSLSMGAALMSFAALATAQNVTGAGASFPAPLYSKWAADYYKATGVKINYQSVGSGAGLRQIEAKTVDFGASDAPLKDEDLAKKGLVQFPMVIGGVVPVVNIKGIASGQLKLNGQVLGDIYLGKITKWTDPAIKALNPSLALPDAAITPVRRADGSGTSFIFTNYLSKANAEWKNQVGEGTAVNWPVGAGGKGNEGVAAFVGRLPNSIGYVEYAFILMHKVQEKPAQAASSLKFFEWAYKTGDKTADDLDYVPMPAGVKAIVEKAWGDIKDGTGKPVAYK